MWKRENHTVWCTYTLVSIGMLAALQVILSRFLAVPIGGFGRVALSPVASIMSGLWLGPLAGGLTGLIADLVGCVISGYSPNPLITCAAALWGVLPGLLCPAASWKRTRKILTLSLGVGLSALVCSAGLTTAGLVLLNGFSFYAIFPTRLAQLAIMLPLYCLLVSLLYFSPVTGMTKAALTAKGLRKAAKGTGRWGGPSSKW